MSQASVQDLQTQTKTPPRGGSVVDHTNLAPTSYNDPDDFHPSHQDTNPSLGLISPTKFRQQAKQSAQISSIDSWLRELFAPNSIPPHLNKWKEEVNATPTLISSGVGLDRVDGDHDLSNHPVTQSGSILKALQYLKQVNLSADERNRLLHDARLEELRSIRIQEEKLIGKPGSILLNQIWEDLTPAAKVAMDSLANGGVTLGIQSMSNSNEQQYDNLKTYNNEIEGDELIRTFAQHLHERTIFVHELQSTLTTLQNLHADLSAQLESAKIAKHIGDPSHNSSGTIDHDTTFSSDHNDPDFRDQKNIQTQQFIRETKQLTLKLTEYRTRIDQLERSLRALDVPLPPQRHRYETNTQPAIVTSLQTTTTTSTSIPTPDSISAKQKRIKSHHDRIQILEKALGAFNDLPADYEASRIEVRRAMSELQQLKERRERLFERTVNGT